MSYSVSEELILIDVINKNKLFGRLTNVNKTCEFFFFSLLFELMKLQENQFECNSSGLQFSCR